MLHADAALSQHGVAFIECGFRQHDDGQLARKVERTIQACHAASDDDDVAEKVFVSLIHVALLCCVFQHALKCQSCSGGKVLVNVHLKRRRIA